VSKLKNVCAISISLPLTKAAVILRLRELARDIDFPAKAATETLPIAFQRSLFSDEIERGFGETFGISGVCPEGKQ